MSTKSSAASIQPCTPQGEFANQPFIDFNTSENARKMHTALEFVYSQLGREYDLVIGGQRIKTADKIRSLNPARPAQIKGQCGSSRYMKPTLIQLDIMMPSRLAS